MQAVSTPDPVQTGPAHNARSDVKQRLSRALFELNLKLASCNSGALVQVWVLQSNHLCWKPLNSRAPL